MVKAGGDGPRNQSNVYKDKSKPADVRSSNMTAAKGNKHPVNIIKIDQSLI